MPKKYTPTATKAKGKKDKRRAQVYRSFSPEPTPTRPPTPSSAPSAPSGTSQPRTPSRRTQERLQQVRVAFDYRYVMNDLRRIGVISGIILAIIIILAVVLR